MDERGDVVVAYKNKKDRVAYAKAYSKMQRATPKGRAQRKTNNAKYNASEKGKETRRLYVNSPKYRQQVKRYRSKVRMEVLTYYSKGKPNCACCGIKHVEFLTIDHKDGGGSQHRKQIGNSSFKFYLWLRKNKYPKNFQVLCHNCNFAKHVYKVCPHNHKGPKL